VVYTGQPREVRDKEREFKAVVLLARLHLRLNLTGQVVFRFGMPIGSGVAPRFDEAGGHG